MAAARMLDWIGVLGSGGAWADVPKCECWRLVACPQAIRGLEAGAMFA